MSQVLGLEGPVLGLEGPVLGLDCISDVYLAVRKMKTIKCKSRKCGIMNCRTENERTLVYLGKV